MADGAGLSPDGKATLELLDVSGGSVGTSSPGRGVLTMGALGGSSASGWIASNAGEVTGCAYSASSFSLPASFQRALGLYFFDGITARSELRQVFREPFAYQELLWDPHPDAS